MLGGYNITASIYFINSADITVSNVGIWDSFWNRDGPSK